MQSIRHQMVLDACRCWEGVTWKKEPRPSSAFFVGVYLLRFCSLWFPLLKERKEKWGRAFLLGWEKRVNESFDGTTRKERNRNWVERNQFDNWLHWTPHARPWWPSVAYCLHAPVALPIESGEWDDGGRKAPWLYRLPPDWYILLIQSTRHQAVDAQWIKDSLSFSSTGLQVLRCVVIKGSGNLPPMMAMNHFVSSSMA